MTLTRKALPPVAILALFAMVAAFGLAPIGARAADHLDAPGLMSPAGEARLDIWAQRIGKLREVVTDNSTAGDVEIRFAE